MSNPFNPYGAGAGTPTASNTIAVTAAVQQIALPHVSAEPQSVRVVNNGTQNIAWTYGVAAGLTLANGVLMLPNTVETFMVPGGATQMSVIGAAVGSSLTITVGDGL